MSSTGMGLDIRQPLGLLFVILGLLLAVYGIFSSSAIYRRSLGYDVNLVWGICLVLFGVVCLILAARERRKKRAQTPGAT